MLWVDLLEEMFAPPAGPQQPRRFHSCLPPLAKTLVPALNLFETAGQFGWHLKQPCFQWVWMTTARARCLGAIEQEAPKAPDQWPVICSVPRLTPKNPELRPE